MVQGNRMVWSKARPQLTSRGTDRQSEPERGPPPSSAFSAPSVSLR